MLTLDETGRLVGGYAWVELRLFEVVGSWVPLVRDPEATAHLAAQSRHHAAHAETWLGHRPVVAGRDADDLVAPPTAGADLAIAALASGSTAPGPGGNGDGDRDESGASIDRLAGLYRAVLPRLVASYATHLDAVSAIADPALRRSLRQVAAETVDDWAHGERVLQGLLASPDDVTRAGLAQAQVESALVAGGGLVGRGMP
jgi:hypothetical protein